MWPTSVAIPVATTTNSPEPRVTLVFMYTMSVRSPSGVSPVRTAAVPFDTGRLSPVSADSATSRVAARSSRPSAGTMSPASIATMSPGTSCSAGSCASAPSRVDPRRDDHHLLQRGHRRGGLALLAQTQHGVEHGEQQQQDAGAHLLERVQAPDPGDEEHQLHRVRVLAQEGVQARLGLRRREPVRAELLHPGLRLGRGQALVASTSVRCSTSSTDWVCQSVGAARCGRGGRWLGRWSHGALTTKRDDETAQPIMRTGSHPRGAGSRRWHGCGWLGIHVVVNASARVRFTQLGDPAPRRDCGGTDHQEGDVVATAQQAARERSESS